MRLWREQDFHPNGCGSLIKLGSARALDFTTHVASPADPGLGKERDCARMCTEALPRARRAQTTCTSQKQ